MAAAMVRTMHHGVGFLFRKQIGSFISVPVARQIFGNNVLSIDTYIQIRDKTKIQFHGMREKFILRMTEHTRDNPVDMVFTEDLKSMIHLVENKPEELDLMKKMIYTYNRQNAELRFATYTFGPVIMRCLHLHGADELAYELITDEKLGTFFNQFSSFVVAMDMLWKKEKYSQVIDLFELLKSKQLRGNKFHKDAVMLFMASCYKLNTPDALNLVRSAIKEIREVNGIITRKALTFAEGLAMNQNSPETMMEIFSLLLTSNQNHYVVKNFKLIALAKLGRVTECLEMLKSYLARDLTSASYEARRTEVCNETLAAIRSAVELEKSKSDLATFERTLKMLREENLISKESLDESICSPILIKPVSSVSQRVGGYESRFFASEGPRQQQQRFERPRNDSRNRSGLYQND